MSSRFLCASYCLFLIAVSISGVSAAEADDDGIIILGLGSSFTSNRYPTGIDGTTVENMRKQVRVFAEHGFNMCWDGSPHSYMHNTFEDDAQVEFFKVFTRILHENGMGSALCLSPDNLLVPAGKTEADKQWFGQCLDPETGKFIQGKSRRWNFGNSEALKLFRERCEKFFQKIGSCEMFCVDEVILAAPGKNGHMEKMSGYWTSPTYTKEALDSFRLFLHKNKYKGAKEAKFPVTTIARKPGKYANLGLPAVPLTKENSDMLQADNKWPKSELWKAWYEWRENILTAWVATEMAEAEKAFSSNPNWQGCMYSAPHFWFDPALGLNADKIASIPQLKMLVKGYWSRDNISEIRKAAQCHGKKWGGMVETAHYGVEKGTDTKEMITYFKYQVKKGASYMMMYPLTCFREDRPVSNEKYRKTGSYYMPEQIEAWDNCMEWLKKVGKVKKFEFSKSE